jgi:ketopantoate reductase
VEIFAGKVVSMGKEDHVPTPVNDAVLHIIKVLEVYSPRYAFLT